MKKDSIVYLQDISDAIAKIERYTYHMSFDEFVTNQMCQDAVIKNLEVIGEAAHRLSEDFSTQHPTFPLKETIDLRNFLVHDYSNIDLNVVWKTIMDDIPPLKTLVSGLISH
ncbi:DUF86 domain-containing protein [candidate division WWE3 bacterium CG_4_9_14_3_um_filter_41_6]|uniref:DUF86 domain-containing protein n=1 Tax=candidate division WWE3 bacterium CG_4_10_14_0_2_um_filter_41_14 TaxID=1975072 RepID=A0A2M7TLG6_UNCKA|nr:MAG: DUF86 domain-containing protein [candidate division WWE3 bacterium CG_4_10_14_0_2_um_filter_41_14]PJA38668.1 MAG: DUF86 domain-containing protein [candidate division WWE3 bacterium CG_4_9_14_3_um_filter_41_6]